MVSTQGPGHDGKLPDVVYIERDQESRNPWTTYGTPDDVLSSVRLVMDADIEGSVAVSLTRAILSTTKLTASGVIL